MFNRLLDQRKAVAISIHPYSIRYKSRQPWVKTWEASFRCARIARNNRALCRRLMASDKLGPSIGYGVLIKLPVSILYDAGFGWRVPSRGWSFRGLEWAPSNSSAYYAEAKPGSFEFTNARVAGRGRIAQGRVRRISLPSCLPAGLVALETWEFTGKTCPRARESTPIHKRKITGELCVGRPRWGWDEREW